MNPLPTSATSSVINSDGERHPDNSHHKISAIYTSEAEAAGVKAVLIAQGFAAEDIEILESHAVEGRGPSDEVVSDILVDSAIGTAVGAGLGAVGTAILITASATLFIASPILAPLALIGNLATVGGLLGAVVGASHKEAKFSDVVKTVMKAGNVLLLVHTRDENERELAKDIITNSFRGRDEVVMESS